MPLESTITKNIRLKIKKLYPTAFVRKLSGGRFQGGGMPDLYACVHGVPFHLEVKQPGNKATPLQRQTMRALDEAGACTAVVFSVEEALAVIQQALKLRRAA
jgi:hypothetical protein